MALDPEITSTSTEIVEASVCLFDAEGLELEVSLSKASMLSLGKGISSSL